MQFRLYLGNAWWKDDNLKNKSNVMLVLLLYMFF